MNKLCFKHNKINGKKKNDLDKFFLVHVPILNWIFCTTDMTLKEVINPELYHSLLWDTE